MPTITIELEEDVDRLIELYKAAMNYKNKQEAINKIVKLAKQEIMKEVKA